MSTITLFGFPPSSFTRSARLACVAKGVDYSLAPLDFKSASHFERHPFGKMPVMEHGDVRLFETAAILDYVDAAFDGPALMPTSTLERAVARQWMSAAADSVYDDVVGILHGDGPTDDEVAVARSRLAPFDRALAESTHLAGDAMSLADLYVLPMVTYAAVSSVGDALLADAPNLRRWREALEARDGFSDTLSS